MDVKELMVGDYVISTKRNLDEILKVVSIDGGTNICWLDGDSYSGCVAGEDIKPIPLTEELLENNDFKKINCLSKPDSYFYRLTIVETHPDHTYNTWLLEVDNKQDYFVCDGDFQYDEILQGEICNYKIKFVHELQQIMRKLKFNKDISL